MCERSGPRPYCSVDRLGLGAAGPPRWLGSVGAATADGWLPVAGELESHRPSQPATAATARALRAMLLAVLDRLDLDPAGAAHAPDRTVVQYREAEDASLQSLSRRRCAVFYSMLCSATGGLVPSTVAS